MIVDLIHKVSDETNIYKFFILFIVVNLIDFTTTMLNLDAANIEANQLLQLNIIGILTYKMIMSIFTFAVLYMLRSSFLILLAILGVVLFSIWNLFVLIVTVYFGG
jgi:hypothetical protein